MLRTGSTRSDKQLDRTRVYDLLRTSFVLVGASRTHKDVHRLQLVTCEPTHDEHIAYPPATVETMMCGFTEGDTTLIIIMAGMAVFYVAGYLIEESRRWPVITAARGQCSK